MYTESRDRAHPQAETLSAPDEASPLLSSPSKTAKSHTSWLSPTFVRTPPKKQQDVEDRSAEHGNPDEESSGRCKTQDDAPSKRVSVMSFIAVLYFGAWLASADATTVIAIYNTIGSDLGRFQDALWILAAYHLGLGPAQPLYGKLSDIFGHKKMITVAYSLFGIGCLLCGLGDSLTMFAAGRVVTGVGGAGMRSLVSSLIVHLVPLRDIAGWRSWLSVMVTFGRSAGAPLGGLLADSLGWRGSFIYQTPLALLALMLVWWRLPNDLDSANVESSAPAENAKASKLRRIDFLGAFLLATSIFAFLLLLNLLSKRLTFTDPVIIGIFLLWIGSCLLWLFVEARFAPEPIFPLRLLFHRDVLTTYLIVGLGITANMSMFSSVALYFRITERASNTVASAHLLPSLAGNILGSLLSGEVIKRTGRYKPMVIAAPVSSSVGFLLLFLRWNGHTSFVESLYIALAGFGNGITMQAVFIFLSAGIKKSENAIAGGGFYLSSSLGEVTGMSCQSALLQAVIRRIQIEKLGGADAGAEIIRKVTASVDNIWTFPSHIQTVIVDAYVQALKYTYLFSLGCSLATLLLALTVREHGLGSK